MSYPSKWVRRSIGSPDTAFVKLQFSDVPRTFNSTGPGIFYDTYQGNSVYDPRVAVGGSSAQMLSFYTLIYQKYCVLGAKIKVQFLSGSAAATRTVGFLPYPGGSTISSGLTANQLLTQPYCRWKLLGPVSSSRSVTTMTQYMSSKKIFGKDIVNLEEYASVTNTNPALGWYWQVFSEGTDTAVNNVTYQVSMTLYVKMFDRSNYVQNT